MKANEFVKEHGWDEAKKVIFLQDSPIYEVIWDIKNKRFKNDNGFATLLCETNDNFVFVPYLKQLVESHKLVESYGGIDAANKTICDAFHGSNYPIPEGHEKLSLAIQDVESCQ